jgi:hypothetical protein
MLGAGVGTSVAFASIWRLRRDAWIIEAAESFEPVNLTTVIKRYVPAKHQTHVAHQEIAMAKQVIVARRPRQMWIAVAFVLVLVGGATATVFSLQRYLEMASSARTPRPDLNVLNNIQGVWGWRANFLLSCAENPQTIAVAPDRKTLTMRYAKPYKERSETNTDMTFDVVSVERDKIVLLRTDSSAFAVGKPTPFDVLFVDANTMIWASRHNAMESSGAIERCSPV